MFKHYFVYQIPLITDMGTSDVQTLVLDVEVTSHCLVYHMYSCKKAGVLGEFKKEKARAKKTIQTLSRLLIIYFTYGNYREYRQKLDTDYFILSAYRLP